MRASHFEFDILSVGSQEVPATKRRSKKNESLANDISFTSFLSEDLSNIFAPPRNLKSLLLPVTRDSFSNRLPENCFYHPEDLLKLFLCPKIKVSYIYSDMKCLFSEVC